MRHAIAEPDVFQQVIHRLQVGLQQDGFDLALGHFIQLRAKRGQGFVEQAASQGDGFECF